MIKKLLILYVLTTIAINLNAQEVKLSCKVIGGLFKLVQINKEDEALLFIGNNTETDTIYKFKSSSPFNSCCSNDSIAVFVENSSIDAYLNFFGEKDGKWQIIKLLSLPHAREGFIGYVPPGGKCYKYEYTLLPNKKLLQQKITYTLSDRKNGIEASTTVEEKIYNINFEKLTVEYKQ
jgi:hypothetical protein